MNDLWVPNEIGAGLKFNLPCDAASNDSFGDAPSPLSSDLLDILARLGIFSDIPRGAIQKLLAKGELIEIKGGVRLFAQGETANDLFVVVRGRMAAYRRSASGKESELVGMSGHGQLIGEMAIITGAERAADVYAQRDSELLKISAACFDELVANYPAALRKIAATTIEQVTKSRPRKSVNTIKTIAFVSDQAGIDMHALAIAVSRKIGIHGKCTCLTSKDMHDCSAEVLERLESQFDFIMLVANSSETEWKSRCCREADAVVHCVDPACSSKLEIKEPGIWGNPLPKKPEFYFILHLPNNRERNIEILAKNNETAKYFNIRRQADFGLAIRTMLGRSTGLVLSGGGARGFAHIGVVRALREAGLEIDAVGGTSMGALVAAAIAHDWPIDQITESFRSVISERPVSDYTLPILSLVRGKRYSNLLHRLFGDIHIENLPLPFFCVSASLTSGNQFVHRSGSLVNSLRASSCIPGIFPPIYQDGMALVDGGLVNNLPVDLMKSSGIGHVIAVDIGKDSGFPAMDAEPSASIFGRFSFKRGPSILSVLARATTMHSSSSNQVQRMRADTLLAPPVSHIGMLDWKQFDQAVNIGYDYARDMISCFN